MTDRETLIAEVPSELKDLVDADSRFNREVVEAALWKEYGGHKKSALEQRVTEQKNRISMIEGEVDARHEELERERRKLEAFREKLDERQSFRETMLSEAEGVLTPEMLRPDNPAVENWAEKVELPVTEFINRMKERLSGDDGE